MRRFVPSALLAAIVVSGFALRLSGISNGLPYSQVPDEGSDITTSLRIGAGDRPTYAYHRVAWPVSQLPVHALHFLYLRVTTPGFSRDDFEARYFTRRSDFVLSIRLLLAALMSLSIIGVYFVGRALTRSVWGGIATAALLAAHPWHVYISHFGLPDGYSLVWVVVALLAAIHIAQSGARWAYLVAGAAVALTMMARLQALLIVVPVGLAHLAYWYRRPNRPRQILLTRWLWALAAFAGASIAFNPFIVLDPPAVIADIEFIFSGRYGLSTDFNTRLAWVIKNTRLPVIAVRPYFSLMALMGAVIAVLRRDWDALIVVTFGVVFTVSILPSTYPGIHFWLPAVIPAVMVAGYGAAISMQGGNRWLHRGGAVVYLVVIGLGLAESLMVARALGNDNTKVLAYDWVTQEIPPGSNILTGNTESYSVPLARNRESVLRLEQLEDLPPSLQFQLDHPAQARQPQYNLFGPEYQGQIVDDATWWSFVRDHEIEYVIEADYCGVSGYRYDATSSIQFPVITQSVRSDLVLLEVFSPFGTDTCQQFIPERLHLKSMRLRGWMRVGPLIRIYRVPRQA